MQSKKQPRPFARGDRVTFKDGQKGFLASAPENNAMGWAIFQSYTGAQFTVTTTGGDITRTE